MFASRAFRPRYLGQCEVRRSGYALHIHLWLCPQALFRVNVYSFQLVCIYFLQFGNVIMHLLML